MQTVILEKNINVKYNAAIEFPAYFKQIGFEEYYMFTSEKKYLSVTVVGTNFAFITLTSGIADTQLEQCMSNQIRIPQTAFIAALKAAEDIIRNEITNACKMELYELE